MVVFVWGVFVFAKVCFASFAVLGPFTNGPYGVRVFCWIGVVVVWRIGLGECVWPLPSPASPAHIASLVRAPLR